MNPKENALRIIRFDNPEQVVEKCPLHNVTYHGCNHEGIEGEGPDGIDLPVGSVWTDFWGTQWRKEQKGVMGFPRGNPLANLVEVLPTYSWPNSNDERICRMIYEMAKDWNCDQTFLTGRHRDTLWEKAYMLVGMENLMVYLYTEPNAVKELFHRIMDFQMGIARHYEAVGIELAYLGDDLGTQHRLLLFPKIVETFLVPEYRRLFDFYKQRGVLIRFHSCGHITPLLETFIALGVDILHPVQATANDLDEVRRVTQDRLALHGAVSTATIAQRPIEAIRKEVAQRIWQLGRDGGYFCAPDQKVPWLSEHHAAFEQAVEEFGRYPLQEPA